MAAEKKLLLFLYFFVFRIDTKQKRLYIIIIRQERQPARSKIMKKLFITLGRERDLIRYSEKSDLKDAKEISAEDAISLFKKNFYSEAIAIEFIESVKDNPFNDWCQWR